MQWATAVAYQVVTLVSPGASRHMLAAEAAVVAVVWKEGEVKEPAGGRQEVQLLEAAGSR